MARNEGGEMKLKNKRTGEIVSLEGELLFDNEVILLKQYASLAELNADWEDYEELEYWYIDDNGDILLSDLDGDKIWEDLAGQRKQIGNYFNTREEAEKAVEKLKAWKRLKDKGFRSIGKTYETDKRFGSVFYKVDEDTYSEDIIDDLDLLFSGEDD